MEGSVPNRHMKEPGAWLITPLLLEEGGNGGSERQKVLVNRGWVPDDVRKADPPSERIHGKGTVEVVGYLRGGEVKVQEAKAPVPPRRVNPF